MHVKASYSFDALTDVVITLGDYTAPLGSTVQMVNDDQGNEYEIEPGSDGGLYLSIIAPVADVIAGVQGTFIDGNGNAYVRTLTPHWVEYSDKVKDHPIHGPHKKY